METVIPPPPLAPRPPPPAPVILCGWCREALAGLESGRVVRCHHCGRALSAPSRVTASCTRCGHSQRIRIRESRTEHLCAKCGQTLTLSEIVLPPRRHRAHSAHHHHRYVGGSAHADAAYAVLIIGLTIVIAVLALTVL